MDVKKFVRILDKSHRIKKYCGVSDSTLSPLIKYLESRGLYQAFTNEGDAVAYAAGQTLGGVPTAVLMQNSGITNAMSPLTSLISLYNIPIVCIVGHRGTPGDEPQHKILGDNDIDFISKSFTDDSNTSNVNIVRLYSPPSELKYCETYRPGNPTFYFVWKDALCFEEDLPNLNEEKEEFSSPLLSRNSYIKFLFENYHDCKFISTTGYTSRELMKETGGNTRDYFYMVGSMGCLISFANGVAQSSPNKRFIALDGDGSFLMRPEGLYMTSQSSPDNLLHIVFFNGEHQSTGGQKLPIKNFLPFIEGAHDNVKFVASIEDVKRYLNEWDREKKFMTLVIRVNNEIDCTSLPRPTWNLEAAADNFAEGLLS